MALDPNASGFKSLSIQTRKGDIYRPRRGLQCITFETNKKQYFQPQTGFKGISIERPRVGGVQLICTYRSYGKYAANMVRTITVEPFIQATGNTAGFMLFRVSYKNRLGDLRPLDEYTAVSFTFAWVQNGVSHNSSVVSIGMDAGLSVGVRGFTGGEMNITQCTVTITGIKGTNQSRFIYNAHPIVTTFI